MDQPLKLAEYMRKISSTVYSKKVRLLSLTTLCRSVNAQHSFIII